ncbi:tRNA (N6-isopentenyl adenosine(37)-C2)-methylthiotransferase MiaB [candidate division KSB1 bacterium]|nr:tRNA (N6-isopentenyl adenosine(37)-C2)-methylthiotransferase MiaB [candidate division KSB1 bacterium]RQW04834.1 MAG: tRNA (N6-isopentenyl adenosine(37)-C2)-methylthiotransferase MiaB [candidate division KSB1 bacterium]
MNVYIETYGCQMNEYDSEIVKSLLLENDYILVDNPEQADIILLNTCSVREHASRKVIARVHALRHLNNGRQKKIGLLGCMPTNYRRELINDKKLPIDFIAGPDSYKRLASLIDEHIDSGKRTFDIRLSRSETYSDVHPFRAQGVNAWIAVMRGCDNYCTFCVVPYTRGRERSRSVESIVNEARRLAKCGYKQVTLLGQNVNSYQHSEHDFGYLLDKVSEVDGLERIRFTSPHPKDFPRSLLRVVAENDKVCKHIHLPLQAGNTRILDMMNRTYSKEEFLDLVHEIRDFYPDMVLSTDIIVGFPTETETEFDDTVDVVAHVAFDSAFIFKYSERKGTIAARKYPDDVPEAIKTERIVRLNELQKEISLKKNKAHIGQEHKVLIESMTTKKSHTDVQGRNDGNKLVILPGGDYCTGDFVRAKIVDASAHVLKGIVTSVVHAV